MVIVDSSAWIHYFRVPDSLMGNELARLLEEGDVFLTGVVLAEVLQGARSASDFHRLQTLLGGLPYLEPTTETWVKVGELAVQLRSQGRPIPLTDLLIASLALERDYQVYTLDEHFQRVAGLRLHEAKAG